AIRDERERVKREETRAGGPAGGLAAAPMARECSFSGFMKCGPTQFYETEGAVGLVRWFEKMENTFEIIVVWVEPVLSSLSYLCYTLTRHMTQLSRPDQLGNNRVDPVLVPFHQTATLNGSLEDIPSSNTTKIE
nr:putative reverse transcriptase domain-containing protein [Tanacetum cinerariifolium]